MAQRPDPAPPAQATLAAELDWLDAWVDARIRRYLDAHPGDRDIPLPPAPPLGEDGGPYADFARRYALDDADRLLVALCLAPALRPHALDLLFTTNATTGRGFTEFGGHTVAGHGGFLPTGETAVFLLAGDDLDQRIAWRDRLVSDHPLIRADVIALDTPAAGAPRLSGALTLRPRIIERVTTGRSSPPTYGPAFPAHRLHTRETWDDLVLPGGVRAQVDEIRAWLTHGSTLLREWGFGRRMKPGFRSLFHGPPGTGKTMTAALIGQSARRPVFRVDLSMVVSKYIGETEKNLARVFDSAEGQGWILFFDEADALFGRRTQVRDARDRFANQQIAYLLQRIEQFAGVVLLASNLKDHIDPAFTRRFHSVIYFPLPDRIARRQLWQKALSPPVKVGPTVSVDAVVEHELTGATIMNAVRSAALAALARGEAQIEGHHLEAAIRREVVKLGRSL